MKLLKIIITSLGVVAASSMYISCVKGAPDKVAVTDSDFSNKALVQVFVATVNATRNYIYVDNAPVNGAPIVSGSIFPAVGTGFNLTGGVRSFLVRDTQTITTPVTTQIPLNFAQNLQAGKHYSVFLYDTITTPKQKTVVDNIVIPTDTTAKIRFANFIYNPTIVPAVDVFSFYRNINIFTNVAVTDVTDFVAYPSRLTLDTLYIRETGTMNLLLKIPITLLTPKRSYTLVYRGSYRGTRVGTLYGNY
ncbi:MAG: hypothetical protein ABI688_10880 [Bacteroidota bacterium]